jgi:small-conductance mechanosensitive channel
MAPTVAGLAAYAVPVALAAGGVVAGLVARRVVLPALLRLARRSTWRLDDVLLESVGGPLVLWFALLGAHLAARALPLAPGAERLVERALVVTLILSVTWAAARFTASAMQSTVSVGALPAVTLIANVTRIGILALGGLIVLQTLGLSITPMITALGVGGLAVGLALQDTLANFFAGVRILAAGKVRPGDYILLDSGQDGLVEDITWAQTTIRQMANNVVIVPNSRVAQAITVNYSLPSNPLNMVVPVGVAYGSDLERVERVSLEVAREVLRTSPAGVEEFEPAVRFHTFGDSSITCNVVLQARAFPDRHVIVHAFVKALHARFRAEGIEIPFPQRDLHLKSGTLGG